MKRSAVLASMTISLLLSIGFILYPALSPKLNGKNHSYRWQWPGPVPNHWPTNESQTDLRYTELTKGFAEGRLYVAITTDKNRLLTTYDYQLTSYGWPLRVASINLRREGPTNSSAQQRTFPIIDTCDQGILLSPLTALPYNGAALPLCIDWFALITNVLLLSPAGLAAYLITTKVLWYIIVVDSRRQAGRCVKCNYPIQGFKACPECGTPVKRPISLPTDRTN